MKKYYYTLAGTMYRHGHEFMQPGMEMRLVKEPDNKYDHEAIRVDMEGLGTVGYVANSVKTVVGESYSAGRLYDKIGDEITGKAVYVLPDAVVCCVEVEDIPAEAEPK